MSGYDALQDAIDDSTIGTYTISYNVTDSSGIAADEVTRTITLIDDVKPIITLIGESDLVFGYDENGTYADAGATATDNVDGDISSNIVVSGDVVNLSVPGTYTIIYNLSLIHI